MCSALAVYTRNLCVSDADSKYDSNIYEHLAPYLIDNTTAYPQSACPISIPAVALRRAHNNAAVEDDPG